MSGRRVPVGQGVLPGAAERPRRLSNLALGALAVVRLARRKGRADLTIMEILHELHLARPGSTILNSSLSRELTGLAKDGLLRRRLTKRKSAWEAMPSGWPEQANRLATAYFAPRAGSGRPPAVMTAAASGGAGRGAAPAAGAVVPAGQVAASEPDFY